MRKKKLHCLKRPLAPAGFLSRAEDEAALISRITPPPGGGAPRLSPALPGGASTVVTLVSLFKSEGLAAARQGGVIVRKEAIPVRLGRNKAHDD